MKHIILVLGLCMALVVGEATGHPQDQRVARDMGRIVAGQSLRGVDVGIQVRSVPVGRLIYEHGAKRALIPASNQKLLTLAMSLDRFGPDHEFETPVLATGGVDQGGTLHGDLWVVGSGDPTLDARYLEATDPSAALAPFVDALSHLGLMRVRGDLVVDDRVFDRVWVAPGWPEDQLNRDYCAPVGGLSLAGNCLEVWVTGRPGRAPSLELRPFVQTIRLVSEVGSSNKATELLVDLQRPTQEGRLMARGQVGGSTGTARLDVPIRDPGLFFGEALRQALQRRGITVGGQVRRPADEEGLPDDTRQLFTRHSPLLPALYVCGKESDNMVAEHLWKAAGALAEGLGSFASGEREARAFLEEQGCSLDGARFVDGSGLSRENRVTADLIVDLLLAMYRSPLRDTYLRSLPISGVDGTLRKRLREPVMQYRVRAKTGYLNSVSCLSGYVMAGRRDDPKVYAFSFLTNKFGGAGLRDMQRAQEELCRLLVEVAP